MKCGRETSRDKTTSVDLSCNKILFATIFDLKAEMDQKLYSDQMGHFSVTSYKINQ